MNLSKEIIMFDPVLFDYLFGSKLADGRKGGVFLGNYNIAPESLRTYGIILPKGGMIIPDMKLEVLSGIMEEIRQDFKKRDLDRFSKFVQQAKVILEEENVGSLILYGSLVQGRDRRPICGEYCALHVVRKAGDEVWSLYRLFNFLYSSPTVGQLDTALSNLREYLKDYSALLKSQEMFSSRISELLKMAEEVPRDKIAVEFAPINKDRPNYAESMRPMEASHWLVLVTDKCSWRYFPFTESGIGEFCSLFEPIYLELIRKRELVKSDPLALKRQDKTVTRHDPGSRGGYYRSDCWGPAFNHSARPARTWEEIETEYWIDDEPIDRVLYEWLLTFSKGESK